MTTRESFLARVRQAVQDGNQAGKAPPLPERGGVGRQDAGPDLVARFGEMLQVAGGRFHPVAGPDEAAARILEIARTAGTKRVVLAGAMAESAGAAGSGYLATRNDSDSASLRSAAKQVGEGLARHGREVTTPATLGAEEARTASFASDLGVTGVDYLVAETGSLVVLARPDQPRSPSLLPMVHVAVAERSQIVADLFDLFERLAERGAQPSSATIITGPSKTGDIELKLVTGVHGPGEIHVIVMGSSQ